MANVEEAKPLRITVEAAAVATEGRGAAPAEFCTKSTIIYEKETENVIGREGVNRAKMAMSKINGTDA